MSHRLAKSGRYGAGQIDAANVALRKELEKLDRGNGHNDGAEQSSAAIKSVMRAPSVLINPVAMKEAALSATGRYEFIL